MINRRLVLASAALWPTWQAWAATPDAQAALRTGGVVAAFRHALAPGTFDPPEFRLGDCKTQRLLSEEGRAQARQIGAGFVANNLKPSQVRASPWCRCMDTATLAFGRAEAWAALGSPRGSPERTNDDHLGQLRAALVAATRRSGQFEVWVTHMFVLSDLVATNTASGEGLILQANGAGQPRVLARLPPPG